MPIHHAKKPVRYMDFISRKPSESSDPLASRPETRPVKHSPHIEKTTSVADQIPPKGAHIEKAPKPEPEITIKKETEKPLISREPATSRDLYAEAIDPNKPKTAVEDDEDKPASDHLAMRASVTLSSKPKTENKEPASSPDGNAYSLGGKSPFLPNYTVDKRPLSNSVPTKKSDEQFEKLSYLGVGDQGSDSARKKNIYKKSDEPEKDQSESQDSEPVTIIDDTKKKHGVPIWLIIIITIILGAAAGAGVYFLLPQ